MKFRTDFVTNSSSTGYVAIRVDLHSGETIAIDMNYDTGYGGYFWNSSEAQRDVMKYNMASLKNGEELLDLLAKGIDDFNEAVLYGEDGEKFRSSILTIKDFGDVKSIFIKEKTSFDDGDGKEAELRFENKSATKNITKKKCVYEPVKHMDVSAKEAGKDWTVKIAKTGVTLSKYSGGKSKLTVPACVDGVPVVAIKGNPAKGSWAESVSIPNTVKIVDTKSFCGLKELKKVIIEDPDTEVVVSAFEGCDALEDENGCIVVGGVLHQCKTKGHVVVSSGIDTIPKRIAWGEFPSFKEYHMTSLVIPEGVEVIESEAFHGQNNLEVVVLPSTLKEIGDGAFKECRKLKSIILPEGIQKIGNEAFGECSFLLDINFPDSLEYIGDEAFRWCHRLHCKAPNHVPHIGEQAFRECDSMADQNGMTIVKNTLHGYNGNKETVVIPNGVEQIGYGCFAGHTEIKKVLFPSTLKDLGSPEFVCTSGIFKDCHGLADDNGFVIVGSCLWNYIGDAQEIKIPKGVTMIHCDAIKGKKDGALRKVIVPESVLYAAENSFAYVDVHFEGKVPATISDKLSLRRSGMIDSIPDESYQNGCFMSGDTLVSYKSDKKSVIIPEGVKRIIPSALQVADGSVVVLPDSVEKIEMPIFDSWSNPLEVTIPPKTVILGEDIHKMTVKGWAGSPTEEFVKTKAKHCKFVKVGEEAPAWEVKKLKNGTLYLKAYNCLNQEHVVIPEEIDGKPVSVLGKRLFLNHSEIKRIDVPKTVEVIENECFYNTHLEKVTLSEGLKQIGMVAFEHCGLEFLDVPKSVEKIGGGALRWIKTVIIRGNPQLVKNLEIFNNSGDAKVYADTDTEVYRYVGSRHCAPLEEAPKPD